MKERSLSERVARDSFYNFSTTLISRIGAVIFTIILTRILAPEQFGIYSLATSIVFLLVIIIDTGMNAALLKFVDSNPSSKKSSYFRYIMKLKLSTAIVISTFVLLSAYPISKFIFHKEALFIPLIIGSIYILLLSAESFFSSVFFIFSNVKFVTIKEIISQTSRILLIFLLPFIALTSDYVSTTLLLLSFSLLIIVSFLFIIVKRKYGYLFNKGGSQIDKKKVNLFILYVMIGGLSAMFFSYIDILMIGMLIDDPSYAGYYRAAATIVFGVAGMMTFSNVLLPKFVKLKSKNLGNGLNKIFKYLFLVSVPATFGLLIIGRYVIRTLYGYDYLEAAYALAILSFVLIETPMSAIFYALLSAKGKPELYTKANTYALILNIVLNYILITLMLKISPSAAISGAAIATLISRWFYLFILIKKTNKLLKMKLSFVNIIKPFLATIVMVAAIITYMNYVPDINIKTGTITILIGIFVYGIAVLALKGITREDFRLIRPGNILGAS